MSISNLIALILVVIVIAMFFRAARAGGKNGYVWAVVGGLIYFVSQSVLVMLFFYNARIPASSGAPFTVPLWLQATFVGAPLLVAMILRYILLPIGEPAERSLDQPSSPDPQHGFSRFLIYVPAVLSALWVYNQINLEALRTFVGTNFGPYWDLGYYMYVMGVIYDVIDVVVIAAWALLLLFFGFKYITADGAALRNRTPLPALLAFAGLLIQSFVIIA